MDLRIPKDERERLVAWGCRLDPALIVRLNVYCQQKRIKVYQFIGDLITTALDGAEGGVTPTRQAAKIVRRSKPRRPRS